MLLWMRLWERERKRYGEGTDGVAEDFVVGLLVITLRGCLKK
jgi:hypothetical protein